MSEGIRQRVKPGPRRWRGVCLPWPCEAGVTILEVLIGATVAGIAAVGIALMFGSGQAFVQAEGDNRVAVQIAQARIQEIIAAGFGSTGPLPPDLGGSPEPREEADSDLAAAGHPGYWRATTVTSVCPNRFDLPKAWAVACGPIMLAGTEAKRFTVTVRAVDGARMCGPSPCTDPKTVPVTLATVLILH